MEQGNSVPPASMGRFQRPGEWPGPFRIKIDRAAPLFGLEIPVGCLYSVQPVVTEHPGLSVHKQQVAGVGPNVAELDQLFGPGLRRLEAAP